MNEQELLVSVAIGSLLFLLLALFIVLFVVFYQKKRLKHRTEVQAMELAFSNTLLSSQIEIQEQTLRNISQELHDNIGQGLTLTKLLLSQFQIAHPTAAIDAPKQLIINAINDLRDLSKSLHPDRIASVPLSQSIAQELDMLQRAKTIQINYTTSGEDGLLETQQKIIVFRMFQEIMNNTIKHACATELQVHFFCDEEQMRLIVQDNGIGFDINMTKSIGLTSLHNRAKLLGASLEIKSVVNGGTTATIIIPTTYNQTLDTQTVKKR